MEPPEEQAAEPLLHLLGVGLREREERARRGEDAVGDQGVNGMSMTAWNVLFICVAPV